MGNAVKEEKAVYQMIAITKIVPTPDNPRKIVAGDPTIAELAKSIKEFGVIQPVLCRPHPSLKGYDLRAGERRLVAAGLAGLKEIPAIVREMTDREAVQVTVLENLQREELLPLEEAQGIQTLLDGGWDVNTIASDLGKPATWVIRRGRLTKLSAKWKKFIADKSNEVSLSAAHLELIARLPVETQDAVLESREHYFYGATTIEEVRNVVNEFVRTIAKAPWKADDSTLIPDRPPCSDCARRSSCTPGLFDDYDAPAERILKKDRCLDPVCWSKKLKAFVGRKGKELADKHGSVMLVKEESWDRYDGDGTTRTQREIEKSKKGAAGAVPCLRVTGPSAGTVFYGKLEKAEKKTALSKGDKERNKKELASERVRIACNFAAAEIVRAWAARIWTDGTPAEKTLALARTIHTHEGYSNQGERRARNYLYRILALADSKKLFDLHDAKAIADVQGFDNTAIGLTALGLFDYFDDTIKAGKMGGKKEMPKDLLENAADDFQITAEFLKAHRKDNVLHIGRELGVKCPNNKDAAVKKILAANLPAGTLTPALETAFGVKMHKAEKKK